MIIGKGANLLALLALATSSGAVAWAQASAPPSKAPKAAPVAAPPAPRVITAPPAVVRSPPPIVMIPGPPVAPSEPVDIHDLRPAFVPLVALQFDTTQPSDPIWIKGDRPASSLIARVTFRPAETVVVDQDVGQGAGKKLVLLRALAGDQARFRTMAEAVGAQRIYCADGAALRDWGRIVCFEDRENDGVLDSRIFGVGETGNKAEQLSILGKPEPMATPVRYRPAGPAEIRDIPAAFVNCARGHDRPWWTLAPASLDEKIVGNPLGSPPAGDGAAAVKGPPSAGEISASALRSSRACEPAERVREGEPLHPGTVPKGAEVVRMGELVVLVGPKEEGAPVRLLGLSEPRRLYRPNFGGFMRASAGSTRRQKELALGQKFDRPVLETAGAAEVNEGRRAVGDTILTAGFRHGYMGVLTQDTVIRTLFSKRSLPAGTVLYGVPMSYSTMLSYGGRPVKLPTVGFGTPEPDSVRLVWCVPVQDGEEWSATCLPHQGEADRYTLLKGQKPAFEVIGFSFAANQASNPGAVPVEMKDGDFGKPLSWRFRIKEIADDHIMLTQETLFGDSLISSKDVSIIRTTGGVSGLTFSGGTIAFSEVEGAPDAVNVRLSRPIKIGSDPGIRSGLISFPARPLPSPPLPPPQPVPSSS